MGSRSLPHLHGGDIIEAKGNQSLYYSDRHCHNLSKLLPFLHIVAIPTATIPTVVTASSTYLYPLTLFLAFWLCVFVATKSTMALSMLQLDADPQRSSSVPPPIRPQFNSMLTSDRLRVGSGTSTPRFISAGKSTRKERKSIFKELGLDDDDNFGYHQSASPSSSTPIPVVSPPVVSSGTLGGAALYDDRSPPSGPITGLVSDGGLGSPRATTGLRTQQGLHSMHDENEEGRQRHKYSQSRSTISTTATTTTSASEHHIKEDYGQKERSKLRQQAIGSTKPWYARFSLTSRRPRIETTASAPASTISALHRFTMLALLVAVVLPALAYQRGGVRNVADAGPVPAPEVVQEGIVPRGKSPVEICTRWAQQGEFRISL